MGDQCVIIQNQISTKLAVPNLVKVTPTATSFRNSGGTYVPLPAVIDGNKTTIACSFYSASFRDLKITFSSPIDYLDVTAADVDSTLAMLVDYNGVRLSTDARALFKNGPLTARWKVTRAAAQARFQSGGSYSTFNFYDVTGWAIP